MRVSLFMAAAILTQSAQAFELETLAELPALAGAKMSEQVLNQAQYQLPLSKVRRLSGQMLLDREITLQGSAQAATFELPASGSSLHAFNQVVSALHDQPLSLLYRCEGRDCGPSNLWANTVFHNARLYGVDDQQGYAVWRMQSAEGEQLLSLYAITRGNRRAYLYFQQLSAAQPLGEILPEPSTVLYQLNQLSQLSLSTLTGEPDAAWVTVLAASLKRQMGLRITLAGPFAAQWRDALQAQGISAARMELIASQTPGLVLSRIP